MNLRSGTSRSYETGEKFIKECVKNTPRKEKPK
jgi:hypothetical protein